MVNTHYAHIHPNPWHGMVKDPKELFLLLYIWVMKTKLKTTHWSDYRLLKCVESNIQCNGRCETHFTLNVIWNVCRYLRIYVYVSFRVLKYKVTHIHTLAYLDSTSLGPIALCGWFRQRKSCERPAQLFTQLHHAYNCFSNELLMAISMNSELPDFLRSFNCNTRMSANSLSRNFHFTRTKQTQHSRDIPQSERASKSGTEKKLSSFFLLI